MEPSPDESLSDHDLDIDELIGMVKECNLKSDKQPFAALIESLADLCEDDDDAKLRIVKNGLIENVFIPLMEGYQIDMLISDKDSTNCENVETAEKVDLQENIAEAKNDTDKKDSQNISRESDAALKKMVFDLIVLLLTSDSCMDLLFNSGQGILYKKCIQWLTDTKDYHQLVSSILAIGNFARSDCNSEKIVQDNVHTLLIETLRKEAKLDGDFRIQHACLSTLRNLAIPSPNKSIIVSNEDNVVHLLRTMSFVKSHPVVFKLIATLRMLTVGQEKVATELGTDEVFLTRLVNWILEEDHPGVRAESARLLTWIIKNSKCRTVVDNVVKLNGIEGIIQMISCGSKCGIMQNEAFLALILLFASTNASLEQRLLDAKIGHHIHKFLSLSLNENPPEEIISNLITLLQITSSRSDKLKNHLIGEKILTDLQDISLNGCLNIKPKLNNLMTVLKEER